MHRAVVLFLLFLTMFGLHAAARADGGLVRLSEKHGPYRITVFTSPTPLQAGWMDASVFVQDAASGAVASDVEIVIAVAPAGRPEQTQHYPATREAATNKLFRAARLELPHAGKWELSVIVQSPGTKAHAGCLLDVAAPSPTIRGLAWWIAWPLLPLVFFAVHQVLVHRRRGR